MELRTMEQRLTGREREILHFLGKGLSPADIARKLTLSVETVRCHMKRIYAKLRVHTRGQLVAKYYTSMDGYGSRRRWN